MQQAAILIIDDDYVSMKPLQQTLTDLCHYRVNLSAEEKVTAQLAEQRYDLICLDLMIHQDSEMLTETGEHFVVRNIHFDEVNWRETGLEFLTRLRMGEYSNNGTGTSSTVPVIVLSATADQETVERVESFARTSPTWYVEKPFLLKTVIAQIRTALKEA